MLCLLEAQLFCTETTLQPLLKRRKQKDYSCHTVEAHSCLLYMNVTFDLAEMMPQQARKQLETELETSCYSLGGVRCLYTAVLVSPVQSSPESRFYRDPQFAVNMH